MSQINLDSLLPAQANLGRTSTSQPGHDTLLQPSSRQQLDSIKSLDLLQFRTGHLDRDSILVELAVLQSRCAILQTILTETPSTPLHDKESHNYYARDNDAHAAPTILSADPWRTNPGPFADGHFDFEAESLISQDTDGNCGGGFGLKSLHLSKESFRENYPLPNNLVGADLDYQLRDLYGFDMASLQSGPDLANQAVPATQNFANMAQDGTETTNLSSIPQRPPVVTAVTPSTGNSQRRHQCQHCMMTFGRPSDRDRHALSHDPNASRVSCPFPGCHRVGRHGFLRRDKLRQHRTHMRH
jgi:hypothetical protein